MVERDESSDSVNELILSSEQRLAGKNVRLVARDSDLIEGDRGLGGEEREGHVLGYEPYGDDWHIVYTPVRIVPGGFMKPHDPRGETQPLVNAPLHIRLMAGPRLGPFVDRLLARARNEATESQAGR